MEEIKQVIELYVKGSKTGDVSLLKKVFHKKATMSGTLRVAQLISDSPEIFFSDIDGNISEDYNYSISNIIKLATIATATLEEEGLGGKSFVNHFHLVKVEKEWKIISKLFEEMEV